MTGDQLSAVLRDAVPPLGPPLDPGAVLAAARRRQRQRRLGLTTATGLLVAGVAVGIAVAAPDGRSALPTDQPSPCGSPFTGHLQVPGPGVNDPGQAVAVPPDAGRRHVTLRVGEHLTVGWASCEEHGDFTLAPAADYGPITGSDASIYSSPRPSPSPGRGFVRPIADGVFWARYVAQRTGTVVLHGTGSLGSHGYVEIDVEPITAADGPLVSGRVDLTGLTTKPGPELLLAQPSMPTKAVDSAVIVELDTDGRFSTHMRPGTWSLMGISAAYGDGHARCDGVVVVDSADVADVVVHCAQS